jgi:hypothetical protein
MTCRASSVAPEVLIERWRAGDRAAYEELGEHIVAVVRFVARRHATYQQDRDYWEMISRACAQVVSRLPRYSSRWKFSTWAHTVARRAMEKVRIERRQTFWGKTRSYNRAGVSGDHPAQLVDMLCEEQLYRSPSALCACGEPAQGRRGVHLVPLCVNCEKRERRLRARGRRGVCLCGLVLFQVGEASTLLYCEDCLRQYRDGRLVADAPSLVDVVNALREERVA